jgi:tetratricopeptide (TPR) repeat protein
MEHEEIVAYHLEQAYSYRTQLGPADDHSRTIALRASARFESAGRRASTRGDFVASTKLLRRAVTLSAQRGAERAVLLYEFGNALEWTGDVREALLVFHQAMELAAESRNRSREWLARIRHSWMLTAADPHAKSTAEAQAELVEAVGVFDELGDQTALATVWTQLAEMEWIPCRFERAEIAARRALEYARQSGDGRLLANAISYLIAAQGFGSATPEEGLRTLDELVDDISGSRSLESFALVIRGFHRGMQGLFDEARQLIATSSEISESLNLRFTMAARERLGYIELCAGNARAAEQAYRRNYEILDELGDEGHKSTSAASLARVLCALGRFEEAEGYAAIARRAVPEDDLASQVEGRSAQAMVLAARGVLAEAERLARGAIELCADAEAPNFQGDIRMDLAKILRMAGKPTEAGQAAREALALFERKGNRPSSASARRFIERVDAGESARGATAL